jgi:predicted RNase H-like nuclease (RuvC/YqgF family)
MYPDDKSRSKDMMYQELYDEYDKLLYRKLNDRKEMYSLPSGYVSVKTINGKQYFYLQKRVDGKLSSSYIKSELLKEMKTQLNKRHQLEDSIKTIDKELSKLESAISILSKDLSQKVQISKRCANMDAMDIETRKKTLKFAEAMTALEGIPASKEVKNDLDLWASGQQGYKEGYMKVLKKYHLIEV